jgi:CRP-like cAMP-binding protein
VPASASRGHLRCDSGPVNWATPIASPPAGLTPPGPARHRSLVDQGLIVTSLRDSCLFANADEESLAGIARQLRRRRFRRNETIFHQGDPGDSLHIVSSGAVKIVLPSIEGEEAIIATLRSGDFFGELALLDGAPRSATAVALEASETWTLSRELLLATLDRSPTLRDSLLAGLARELLFVRVTLRDAARRVGPATGAVGLRVIHARAR